MSLKKQEPMLKHLQLLWKMVLKTLVEYFKR